MKNSHGFELGKTYTAANGAKVTITELWRDDRFKGVTQTEAPVVYQPSGATQAMGWADFTLQPPAPVDDAPARIGKLEGRIMRLEELQAKTLNELGDHVGKLSCRIGKMEEEHALEIEQLNQRLMGMSTAAELLHRIRKLESQTYEQQKTINGFFPNRQVDTGSYARLWGESPAETLDRGFSNPPRKSLGWVNVFPDNNVVMFPDKECADEQYRRACAEHIGTTRLACVEIFEGDREAQPKPRPRNNAVMFPASLGWVNVYVNSTVSQLHFSRGTADEAAARTGKHLRVACIEIFEGDGL